MILAFRRIVLSFEFSTVNTGEPARDVKESGK